MSRAARSVEPWPVRVAEAGLVPEAALRWGIRLLVGRRLRTLGRAWGEGALQRLVAELAEEPIAPDPEAANRQHYAVPPAFFRGVLGPRLKYSACYWPEGVEALADAEAAALDRVCRRAGIEAGQRVLDLGCGWGALSLWVASRYPGTRVTAVSHSSAQGRFIRERAGERGLGDRVRFVEADVSDFRPPPESFDRVVSVEMFEHLRDHGRLTARVARWLRPDGRLFVHVFSHRRYAYRFTGEGAGAWMGRHFFTGGLMPSHDLLPAAARGLELERDWWTDGTHYARTAEAWHRNLTAAGDEAARVLARAGDRDPELAVRRWRIFFLAVAELFGYREGREWGVSHYRFRPVGDPDAGTSDENGNANTHGQP